MLRRLVLVFLVLGLLAGAWFLLPNSLFYKRRRPTRVGRFTNRAWGWYAAHGGPPSFQVALETRGRRSGRIASNVLVIARYDGRDYLVSMLGDKSAWVLNARAAGGLVTIRHGRPREVLLEEVPVEERAPIIKAYVQRAFGARPHFPIGPDAGVEEFEAIAADYPVFLITEQDVVPVTTADVLA